MARRGATTTKASRAKGGALRPTPVHSAAPSAVPSALNTPLSSAYPSTYPSEDEADRHYVRVTADPELLSLEKLSLAEAETPPGAAKGKSKAVGLAVPQKPFRFLDLPPELRLQVYELHFAGAVGPNEAVDLDPDNKKRIHRVLLPLLRTCRAMNAEVSHFFFSRHAVRLFPTHSFGRYTRTRKPLLARLTKPQRAAIGTLELRVGPNWNQPPKSWKVSPSLGLADCASARRVRVFATFDPGEPAFDGWRKYDGFYEGFCAGLLDGVLQRLPACEEVEFDGFRSIKLSGELMQGLLRCAVGHGKRVVFGPARGWKGVDEDDDAGAHQAAEEIAASAMDVRSGAPAVAVAVS